MSQKSEFLKGKKGIKFIDLFAGAGGFSEGFLQAYTSNRYFDFRLASDINENCKLTHDIRYNHQLGLDTQFLCQDIMDENFLSNLLKKLKGETIDVVVGGPSCQSFSLAGRRKKFDKRDDLFSHYLKVIKAIQPKYFVMENVKGILTKDEGKIKDRILSEIKSITDSKKEHILFDFLSENVKDRGLLNAFVYKALLLRLKIILSDTTNLEEDFFSNLEEEFKNITKIFKLKTSKSDVCINTVRHGLLLLKLGKERKEVRKNIIAIKTNANIDNDVFVDKMNSFVQSISDEDILESISNSLEAIQNIVPKKKGDVVDITPLQEALHIAAMNFDGCIQFLQHKLKDSPLLNGLEGVLSQIRLYNIQNPIVVSSANFGVPQNRERVLFIGCRKDQELITEIPSTVTVNQKVKIYEALWDLDMINNNETVDVYRKVSPLTEYADLLINRGIDGKPSKEGKLYSEWSKSGRLTHRFNYEDGFYVMNSNEYEHPADWKRMELYNHQTSNQNEEVRARLEIIARYGDYDDAKEELTRRGLDTEKRNYTVLNPKGQSPTIATMPDDFIHYSAFRALTAREMARLQSFEDSFVFQGKRATGGIKRKSEIPQFTLIGNAVPPLMAKAIADQILKKIK